MNRRRISIPVGFFSIAIGLLALANAWRVGVRIWALPHQVASLLTLISLAIWLMLVVFYATKWLFDGIAARSEWADPMQSSFSALIPVSTLLAAQAALAYSRTLAIALFVLGAGGGLLLGVYLQGRLWQGGRPQALVTPAIYLPTVATGFVSATAAATLGWHQLGTWFFGAGLFSWLAIESIILHRVVVTDMMVPALRPTLGIQLAPPVVGGVAYLALTTGAPDIFAQILFGYGLVQALLLTRLLPWIRKQPFTPGYWGFSFGVAALPTMAMRMVERGPAGATQSTAVVLFVLANLIVAVLVYKTVQLWIAGRLLPQANREAVTDQNASPVGVPDATQS